MNGAVRHAMLSLAVVTAFPCTSSTTSAQVPVSVDAQFGVAKTSKDLKEPYPWGSTYSAQIALNYTPFLAVVAGVSQTNFSCTDPICSDNMLVRTRRIYAGPRIRWAYGRRVIPWAQLGMGRVTLDQRGEDVEFRDMTFTTGPGMAFLGRVGIEVLLTDLIALTAAFRYEAWTVQLGGPQRFLPIPGPIEGMLAAGGRKIEMGLYSLDIGVSINHPGRVERERPEEGGHPNWGGSMRR